MKRHIIFAILNLVIFQLSAENLKKKVKGKLEYRISMPAPHTHYFEVEILLQNYDAEYVDFKLPVWTPGSYLVREYAKNVEGFNALSGTDGLAIDVHKVNKNTWRVNHQQATKVLINYRVYAFEGSVRMSFLDADHAFIMANTLLMFVEELRNVTSTLVIDAPEQWAKISTTLKPIDGKTFEFNVPNYDILVDSPIEIGNHETITCIVAGVAHEIVISGEGNYDIERLKSDLKKIAETATNIFGENPNEKYIFFVQNANSRGGGLEHLSSTVLRVNRWSYQPEHSYNSFLALAAHEYFHLWMVKRLKPVELEHISYDHEIYTDILWVMEGFTSYFEMKIMQQAGFYDDHQFISKLLTGIAKEHNAPGARVQSVAEASFDAWIKFYRRNENSSNSQVSYYNKGMILAAFLDLEIIASSSGDKTLDDVVRQLYQQFYVKNGSGIAAHDLQKELEKACNKDLESFFADYVYGTTEMNSEKYLDYAGIELIENKNTPKQKSIGVELSQKENGLWVTSLVLGGAAYESGINVGDELIAIDNFRVNNHNFEMHINRYEAGDTVTFLVDRNGIMRNIEVVIRNDEKVHYSYQMNKNKTEQQEIVFNAWLSKQ